MNVLSELAEVYRNYSIVNSRPPGSLAELSKSLAMGPNGVRAVTEGEVEVMWGAKLPDISEEPGLVASPEILAYFKTVPEQGGPVLLLDRTVKTMTAEEFKAAPKAGGK